MPTRRHLLALAAAAAALPPLGALAAGPAPALSAEDQALVDKAVAYLQGLAEARGRFVPGDGRGAPVGGELFLKRPGKARFGLRPAVRPAGWSPTAARVARVQDNRLKTLLTAYPRWPRRRCRCSWPRPSVWTRGCR